jgi:hypothetical protein
MRPVSNPLEFASPHRCDLHGDAMDGEQPGRHRTIEYALVANATAIDIGWILLGSMRCRAGPSIFGSPPAAVRDAHVQAAGNRKS